MKRPDFVAVLEDVLRLIRDLAAPDGKGDGVGNMKLGALLGGDEPARREGKKLVEKLLVGEDRRCLFIGDFVAVTREAEIEDVFPEPEYLSAVEEAYPGISLALDASETALSEVVNKVHALFKRKNLGVFEKWKPAAILRDRISAAPEKLSQPVCDRMDKVFEAINGVFSTTGSKDTT